MPSARRILRPLLTLLVLAGLVWLGLRVRALTERPPLVETATVTRGAVDRVLAVTGRVRPQQRNRIVPLVGGRLVALTREEGDAVRKGDVLARIDDRTVRAALAQAEAERAERAQRLAQRRREAIRAESLHAQALIPEQDVESARLAVEVAAQAHARAEQAVVELRTRLDDYVLRAPLDGSVLTRPVDPGQIVGLQDLLYELATDDAPWVEAEIDERYIAELTIGTPGLAAPLSGRRTPYRTEVAFIGDVIDRLSGAAVVRLRFLDEPPSLPAGLSLDVNLLVEEHPEALTVPRAAIAGLGGDTWALVVVPPGRTARREVSVIDWPASSLVVTDGLKAGDVVVLEPAGIGEGIEVRTRTDT